MVSAALLRDPALDHFSDLVYLGQAGRRYPGVLVAPCVVLRAMARYLAGAQCTISADLQMVVLAAGDRRHRARLGGRQPAARDRCDGRPDRDALLLRPHAGPVPADRQARAPTAAARQ